MILKHESERREGLPPSLRKWRACLSRHRKELKVYGRGKAVPSYAAWFKFIAELAGRKHTKTQLQAVNNWCNKFRYAKDLKTYKYVDYWAAPGQTLRQRVADCEDYAVLKFFTLRALGWEDLRIVVVYQDSGKAVHAILAVRLGDKWLILDNQLTSIYESRRLARLYKPIYAVDETGWWSF